MKICYLGDALSPHVMKFVNYFAQMGNEIFIVSLRKAEHNNAMVYLIPRRTPYKDMNYLLSLYWLKRIIKSIQPDILHAHYMTSFGLLGALIRFHPFILSAWGTDLLLVPKKSFLHRWLLRFTLKRADLIFADASFMKEELLRYGAVAEKILICPFGVNLTIFNKIGREFKDKDHYEILSMRTLIKNSNIDVIIKSMSILKDRGVNFILNITNRGAEEERLKRLTHDLELNAFINFLGFLKREDTYRYFKSSDIYISLTRSDGASVTLLEAMASGLLPIVSDIPANREWIDDGVNGFLVPLNDPVVLADKITLAIKCKDFRKRAADINQDLIKRRGELQKTMGIINHQYKLLFASSKKTMLF